MTLSYQDLCDQRGKMEEKYQQRKAQLQSDGVALITEYKKSLRLPQDAWFENGREMPHVRTGLFNDSGLFERRPVQGTPLNDNNRLVFNIATVIDKRAPGGEWVYTSISMWYADTYLNVMVSGQTIVVPFGEQESRFYEVCSAIKQSIFNDLSDPDLN
ncbi:TPA: hypothetical protein ACSTLU_000138 [Serratia fonticola]